MSEWKEYRFSDFVKINPTVSLNGWDEYSFVEMKDLEDGNKFCFPKIKKKKAGGSKFQNGDTLFARITPCLENGKICKVKNLENNLGFGSTEFYVLRGNENISDTEFIYYLSRWKEVRDHAEINLDGTSGRQRVPKASFDDLIILMPPLPEQTAIASVLSSLDDKIDLLHRQNATLEKMAETLFRQWFVEEAKEEWEEGTISDLIEVNPPRKLQKGALAPYLEMAGLNTSTSAPTGWYLREFTSGSKFISGDTLLARITPCLENGKAAFVDFLNEDQIGWGSTEFIILRPKKKLHPFFAYTVVRNKDFKDFAESCMQGSSGRQRVDIENLKSYEIAIPPDSLVLRFNDFCESITPKLKSNQTQIRTLTALRDTLLPKLMSGEIRLNHDLQD
ncbi:restriction endonuclease subunit S [Arundinibacter roseus]|uniref:Restriction endonuclease subunit S n=1 Tax=Arundinibacter roseus TaxID=2070510 RepID=A0A4R4K9X4_9BACT|nr:restriction endonuclease subunit S [Arundinibacter roseus]TDB64664.1 restriction endonuclease subunit S [Arundinibacter roseus]